MAPPQSERDAISHAFLKLATEQNPIPPVTMNQPAASAERVKPLTVALDKVRITPLLTPDNDHGDKSKGQYLTNIIGLVSRAKKSIYIQLQYIESLTGGTDYDTLLKAIADQASKGLDIRLIENGEYGEKWAEKMKLTGVDLTASIWMQPSVHNKGFVIDSSIVVVSSQNFSPAGVRQNRDAGVIIENERIAQYFEQIFLSDLKNKAKKFAPKAAAGPSTSKPRARESPAKKSTKPAKAGRRKKGAG